MHKLRWEGRVTSVQPRIRLTRSFDERSHTYLGYGLRIQGRIDEDERELWIGVGKTANVKHRFVVGMTTGGECEPVQDTRLETVEFYKVTKLRVLEHPTASSSTPPPWLGVPPDLPTYRRRGHRRLATTTYRSKCSNCIWGSHMAVEMIVDHWNPQNRRYRTETFCYGPKNCPSYKPGPARKVPGRRGMTFVEEDWIDDEAVAHRSDDE